MPFSLRLSIEGLERKNLRNFSIIDSRVGTVSVGPITLDTPAFPSSVVDEVITSANHGIKAMHIKHTLFSYQLPSPFLFYLYY